MSTVQQWLDAFDYVDFYNTFLSVSTLMTFLPFIAVNVKFLDFFVNHTRGPLCSRYVGVIRQEPRKQSYTTSKIHFVSCQIIWYKISKQSLLVTALS